VPKIEVRRREDKVAPTSELIVSISSHVRRTVGKRARKLSASPRTNMNPRPMRGSGDSGSNSNLRLQPPAAESAHEVNHETNQQSQTEGAATVDGAAHVETAAAKEQEKQEDDEHSIHSHTVTH
jgi:hypothetical protein